MLMRDDPQLVFEPAPPQAPEATSGALNGVWALESGEDNGIKLTPQQLRTARLLIKGPGPKGPEYTLHTSEEFTVGVFSMMAADNPKSIVIYDYRGPRANMAYGGLYEFDGDTLRMSLGKPGENTPRQFSEGSMIRVWKRQPP